MLLYFHCISGAPELWMWGTLASSCWLIDWLFLYHYHECYFQFRLAHTQLAASIFQAHWQQPLLIPHFKCHRLIPLCFQPSTFLQHVLTVRLVTLSKSPVILSSYNSLFQYRFLVDSVRLAHHRSVHGTNSVSRIYLSRFTAVTIYMSSGLAGLGAVGLQTAQAWAETQSFQSLGTSCVQIIAHPSLIL